MLLASAALLTSCAKVPSETQLSSIKSRGELRVAIVQDLLPPADVERVSLELTLAGEFADSLGLRLKTVPAHGTEQLARLLENGDADLALAVAQNSSLARQLHVTRAYAASPYVLVHKQGRRQPDDLRDLDDARLRVAQGSRASELLGAEKEQAPELRWLEMPRSDSELLGAVIDETIDYTIVSAHLLRIKRQHYPALTPAFVIGDREALAWATARRQDAHEPGLLRPDYSLLDAADRFLAERVSSGHVAALEKHLYGPIDEFNYLESRRFVDAALERLPQYREWFEQAAAQDLDWRLLAAIAYQESHWREDAVSATGVQGLMMLTQDTAARVGIVDRTDPQQSIHGGALYFREMHAKIPERIQEPDRTWFTLAAYNVGFGHLEDARILTQRKGGNPDRWDDVKRYLPLLREEQYYAQSKHGFCRGNEPVHFVANIQRYHTTLRWLSGEVGRDEQRRMAGMALAAAH